MRYSLLIKNGRVIDPSRSIDDLLDVAIANGKIAALSKNKVYDNFFDHKSESEIDHISLSRWCDIILVAPTTANTISKFANGTSNDLASTLVLGFRPNLSFFCIILKLPNDASLI